MDKTLFGQVYCWRPGVPKPTNHNCSGNMCFGTLPPSAATPIVSLKSVVLWPWHPRTPHNHLANKHAGIPLHLAPTSVAIFCSSSARRCASVACLVGFVVRRAPPMPESCAPSRVGPRFERGVFRRGGSCVSHFKLHTPDRLLEEISQPAGPATAHQSPTTTVGCRRSGMQACSEIPP